MSSDSCRSDMAAVPEFIPSTVRITVEYKDERGCEHSHVMQLAGAQLEQTRDIFEGPDGNLYPHNWRLHTNRRSTT